MGCKEQFFKQSPVCFAIYFHYLTEIWGPSQQQWVWACQCNKHLATAVWFVCLHTAIGTSKCTACDQEERIITNWPEWPGKWCSMSTWWVQEPHPPKDLCQKQYRGKERGIKRSAWDRRGVQRKWVDERQSRMMHASVQRWLVLSVLVEWLYKATVTEKRSTNFLRALQASSWGGS